MTPCNHEEADTEIFVHVKELVLKGHKVVSGWYRWYGRSSDSHLLFQWTIAVQIVEVMDWVWSRDK